ncbi:MAG: autotransporter outer membrane beta-barrel domain-containing protein [Methylococcaceae bacterium]
MKITRNNKTNEICLRLLLMIMVLPANSVLAAVNSSAFWINGSCVGASGGSALEGICTAIANTGGRGSGLATIGSNFDVSGGLGGDVRLDAMATELQKRIEKRKSNQVCQVSGGLGGDVRLDAMATELQKRIEKRKSNQVCQMATPSERFSLYINGKTSETDRKTTTDERGYDGDDIGFTVGMDYVFNNALLAGLAVTYSDMEIDFSNNAGQLEAESVNVALYMNYSPFTHFDIDGFVGWTGGWQENKRNFDLSSLVGLANAIGTATGDTESNKFSAGLGASYGFHFDKLKVTPRVSLVYSDTWIDGYKETSTNAGAALRYGDQAVHSFKTNTGVSISYPFSQTWGVWIPQIRVFHVHEFNDDKRTFNNTTLVQAGTPVGLGQETDSPDRDYVTLGASVSTVLKHGVQLFIDYERREGHRYINNYTFTGGVRVSF